jgi:hypothetical protein
VAVVQALLAGGPFRTRHGRTASSFRILGCGRYFDCGEAW